MSAVSETIVHEYFELHGFFVRQQRKYISPAHREEEEIDFLVFNPHPQPAAGPLPTVLASTDLPRITAAVVVVKGWHTETFSSAVLAKIPEIFRFVEPPSVAAAARIFGCEEPPVRILVVPALPQNPAARTQSLDFLRQRGIDTVIPFRTLLADLIACTETNRNYQKSDLLQMIRVLKTYDFFKDPQLELFKPARAGSGVRRARRPAPAAPPGAPPTPPATLRNSGPVEG